MKRIARIKRQENMKKHKEMISVQIRVKTKGVRAGQAETQGGSAVRPRRRKNRLL
jgi:hypothetical protein